MPETMLQKVFRAYENGENVFLPDGTEWAIKKIANGRARLWKIFFNGPQDKKGRVGTVNVPVDDLRVK